MPVIGSSLVLNCAMLHAGVTRLSDEEFSDVMRRGMSWAVCIAIFDVYLLYCVK
jgi:hypothetical protein